MWDDIDMNIENVIFLGIKKARLNPEHKYSFGCLLTRFLRSEGIEEEAMNFWSPVSTNPIDVSRTKRSYAYCIH